MTDTTPVAHTIAGATVTMPVRIRRADNHLAVFSVPAAAAQQMIGYSGLRVCEYRPGRALTMLTLVRYHDGDLGCYREFGTAVLVNPPGSAARGVRSLAGAGAFIHHLPVDQPFTLEAGRSIWGFPKILADFSIREDPGFGFEVSAKGRLIAGIEFAPGLAVPARTQTMTQYSHLDGVTREVHSRLRSRGLRARPGGASLRLGDHPYADELRALGLPKRAVATMSCANVEMTFGDAIEIGNL